MCLLPLSPIGGAKGRAAACGLGDEVLQRNGWQFWAPRASALGPAFISHVGLASQAVLAFMDADDTEAVDAAEAAMRTWRRSGALARGLPRPPLVAVLAYRPAPDGAADLAALCAAQGRLLAAGADDAAAISCCGGEAAAELSVALRVARCRAVAASGAHHGCFGACGKTPSEDSLDFSVNSYSDEEEEDDDEGMAMTCSEVSAGASTACSEPQRRCTAPMVDSNVNMEAFDGKLRPPSSAGGRPPKMPVAAPEVAVKPDWRRFDGHWVARSLRGAATSSAKLAPAFQKICIADGRVMMADGAEASLHAVRGKSFLFGGELSLQGDMLIRKGTTGAVVAFARERRDLPRGGRRRVPVVRRRDLLRSLVRRAFGA